mmetsp:Transcript_25477/g.63768  ORF Transcript_25477/g.63768 Transcript_25477/m.63768 type:complete len:268 (+) Transcript_25477:1247-2050(+)
MPNLKAPSHCTHHRHHMYDHQDIHWRTRGGVVGVEWMSTALAPSPLHASRNAHLGDPSHSAPFAGGLQVVVFAVVRHVQLLYGTLDEVDVAGRGLEVQRHREVHHSLVGQVQLFVDLSHEEKHARLTRRHLLERLQLFQRLLEAVVRHKHGRALVLSQRVPCVQRDGAAQQVQGVGGAAQRVQRHAQVAVQHRAAAVDAQRVPEVVLRQLELLLPVVHRAQAVPCVVVSGVQAERGAVACSGLLEVLVGEVLVPAQGVRIRAPRVQL